MFLRIALFFLCVTTPLIGSKCPPPPLVAVGGGYWDAKRYSGPLAQLEYRFGRYIYKTIRPQVIMLAPKFCAFYVGVGLGFELNPFGRLIVVPSFSPGIYFKGKGRDLGFPLEFRSCLDIAYQFDNCARCGVQIYHLSNASIGKRNPGGNALSFYVAMPIR